MIIKRRPCAITPTSCECGDHSFATIARAHTVLCSIEDAEFVGSATWWVYRGYALGMSPPSIKNKRMHRLLLDAEDGTEVDHANRDRLDNRRSNIRLASRSQNVAQRKLKLSQAGYRGVRRNSKSFSAIISKDNVDISLGNYPTAEQAARAYDAGAIRLFGDFALTNEMLGLLGHAFPARQPRPGKPASKGRASA